MWWRHQKETISVCLTLSWRKSLSYSNQSIYLQSKSMDWFLYDRDLRYESLMKASSVYFINWVINIIICHRCLGFVEPTIHEPIIMLMTIIISLLMNFIIIRQEFRGFCGNSYQWLQSCWYLLLIGVIKTGKFLFAWKAYFFCLFEWLRRVFFCKKLSMNLEPHWCMLPDNVVRIKKIMLLILFDKPLMT